MARTHNSVVIVGRPVSDSLEMSEVRISIAQDVICILWVLQFPYLHSPIRLHGVALF